MSYFETSFENLCAQAHNLSIWCANIWSNCKCAFPLCHLLSQDLRLQLRICALSHATSPPGVNTTLTRASHSDRHTGKLAPTISIPHLVLQLASYLILQLSHSVPFAKHLRSSHEVCRGVCGAHAPHASFPLKLPPGCLALTCITQM